MASSFEKIAPRDVHQHVQQGFKRLQNFRSARLMFIRNYTGQYYDQESGEVGTESLNLIFNAIRVLIPNIVMNFPTHNVKSNYLASKDYGELLGLALQYHDKVINIRDTYRAGIVDAVFTLGILKTGIAESDSVYVFDEDSRIDTGEVYTSKVDFDNYVVDPRSREHLFRDALWEGDRICMPRQRLLESGLYDNEIVERLPSIDSDYGNQVRAEHMSQRKTYKNSDTYLEEEVEIVELWVPGANAIITVPGSNDFTADRYLRIDDAYGPAEGPYTKLALTPPVPGNPLPVPAVGVWNDLHILSNRMAKKIIDQAERQKDILLYRPSAADDAAEVGQAMDGEGIAVQDPSAINMLSLGGQQQSNEIHIAQLQNWFNQMSGNTEGLAGTRFDADSATEARILSNNANVGLEDMKDLVYIWGSEEARKRAWYFHTDPFIEVPLVKRTQVPAQYGMTPEGPLMVDPGRMEDTQIFLTPEVRNGDFMHFTFDIELESMGRQDGNTRLMQAFDFATKILPSAMQAAQTAFMLGIPFNVKEFIVRMAKDAGIKWMDEVWYDPEFQMRMYQQMMMGPSPQNSKGTTQPGGQPQLSPQLRAMMQNGQPGQVMGGADSPEQQANQQAQAGAVQGQREMRQGGQQY